VGDNIFSTDDLSIDRFNSPAIVLDPATSSGSKSALFLIRNTELSAP